jgi:hypothetical protein
MTFSRFDSPYKYGEILILIEDSPSFPKGTKGSYVLHNRNYNKCRLIINNIIVDISLSYVESLAENRRRKIENIL